MWACKRERCFVIIRLLLSERREIWLHGSVHTTYMHQNHTTAITKSSFINVSSQSYAHVFGYHQVWSRRLLTAALAFAAREDLLPVGYAEGHYTPGRPPVVHACVHLASGHFFAGLHGAVVPVSIHVGADGSPGTRHHSGASLPGWMTSEYYEEFIVCVEYWQHGLTGV